jgi:hypothetical protein
VPSFHLQLRRPPETGWDDCALARTSGRSTGGDQMPLVPYSKPNSLVSWNLTRSSSETSRGTTCTVPGDDGGWSRGGDGGRLVMRSRSETGDDDMARHACPSCPDQAGRKNARGRRVSCCACLVTGQDACGGDGREREENRTNLRLACCSLGLRNDLIWMPLCSLFFGVLCPALLYP